MKIKKIVIGTRGSLLSLKQTDIIKNKLLIISPKLQIETKIIKTKGDKNMKPIFLDTIGKGWFTKELDNELLFGNIDLAVHSLKDVPELLPSTLIIAGIPEREDARDVLVSNDNILLKDLKIRAIVGTDSSRRKLQILQKRKTMLVKSVRGNVIRRLDKLKTKNYDALVLAAAGLKRLGLESRITQYFSATDFIPSPGQGALAVIIKKKNKELQALIEKINHYPTVIATKAERAFAITTGGGCKMPTGAYAICEANTLKLYGMIGSPDGKYIVKEKLEGLASESTELGITLAKKLLKMSKNWYTKL